MNWTSTRLLEVKELNRIMKTGVSLKFLKKRSGCLTPNIWVVQRRDIKGFFGGGEQGKTLSVSINFVNTLETITSCSKVQQLVKENLIEATQNDRLKGHFNMITATRASFDWLICLKHHVVISFQISFCPHNDLRKHHFNLTCDKIKALRAIPCPGLHSL